MDKKIGTHFYINIKNLLQIIKEEEEKDDDLKRTLHRLQTFFVGFSKLIKQYGGIVEKYTFGRAHVIFEQENEDDDIDEKVTEALVACFIYTNNIFNNLGKYSQYENFKVHGGIDFGNYYGHDIDDGVNELEYTSIGAVANNSAKIQSAAPINYIYAMEKFIKKLPSELSNKFIELTDDEKDKLSGKLKSSKIYKVKYSDLFDSKRMSEIKDELNEVKDRVTEEANGLNLGDIYFEGVYKRLSFDKLSLKGMNKRIDEAYVLCADIRGFTKLFNNSDSNLDNLKDVMESIYEIMGSVTNDTNATKVQYQGDRIVAVYNDFSGEEDALLRLIKGAFTLNSKIQYLNEDKEVKEKLNSRKIHIGIGCGMGKLIATRLGLNKSKHNMVLSEAYKDADKAEDKYAEKGEITIYKNIKEAIEKKDEDSEQLDYEVLLDLFTAVSTTGFYKSDATIEEFNDKLSEKEQAQDKEIMNYAYNKKSIKSLSGALANTGLRSWGEE